MRLTKVLSAGGGLYYVPSVANPFSDGWIPVDVENDFVYPFVFFKIKAGKEVVATRDEVERYRLLMRRYSARKRYAARRERKASS